MRTAVGFPVYVTCDEHLHFTLKAIASVHPPTPIIVLFNKDRGSADRREVERRVQESCGLGERYWMVDGGGVSVAAAWNYLAAAAFNNGNDAVVIANTDIVFGRTCLRSLVEFAGEHPEAAMWTASPWPNLKTLDRTEMNPSHAGSPHFSCFMLPAHTFREVGRFDEGFAGAYMEDLDYHVRILRSGGTALRTTSALFYHYGSRTIECDPELKRLNVDRHQKNRAYFLEKWGVDGWNKSAEQVVEELGPDV